MTPTLLQDLLIKEMSTLLSDFLVKNIEGNDVKLNIYSQYLPAKKKRNDIEHFPYLVVRVMDGADENVNEYNMDGSNCKITFIVGVYDASEEHQGYKDVMNTLEKIRQHLLRKISFNEFEINSLKWTLTEEDVVPFYFGGIETNWNIPSIVRENEEGLI